MLFNNQLNYFINNDKIYIIKHIDSAIFIHNKLRRSRRTTKILYRQKDRHIYNIHENTLQWGFFGVRALKRRRWGATSIKNILLLIKKIYIPSLIKKKHMSSIVINEINTGEYLTTSRKRLIRSRLMWCNIRKCLPVLKKPQNSRMGSGRGRFVGYLGNIRAGSILFEFNFNQHILVSKIKKLMYSKFSKNIQFLHSQNLKFTKLVTLDGRHLTTLPTLEHFYMSTNATPHSIHYRTRKFRTPIEN